MVHRLVTASAALRALLVLTLGFLLALVAPPTTAYADGYSAPLTRAVHDLRTRTEVRTGYQRDEFKLWVDADGDGCDTRDEVLISEATDPVTVGSGCSLSGGQWFSYYDAATWTDPSDLDIDHMVPLAEAWDSGARSWTAATREAYANDLGERRTLVAVTDNVNASKSDRDPAEWMPTHQRCRYLREWVAVKHRWRLSVDGAEKKALASRAARCSNTTINVTVAR